MKNSRYTVKTGDTLWGISEQFLGNPFQWPRLYAFNNRPDVIRVTGKKIKDPDLIFVGQKLLLPVLPGAPKPKPGFRPYPKSKQPDTLKQVMRDIDYPFAVKYKLDDLPVIKSITPGFEATIKLSGSVLIKLSQNIRLADVTNHGIEMTYKSQTDDALSQLLSETYVGLDKSNKITFRCNMVSKSTTPNVPSTSIGLAMASDKPVPVLRGEIRYPKLSGIINLAEYTAMNVKVVIEIEPKGQSVARKPEPGFRAEPVTSSWRPSPEAVEEGTKWAFIAGTALLIGTLVADFLTCGASVADDAVTVPLALGMMGIGVAGQELPGQKPIVIH
jgi:LysM repeat protein